MSWIIQSVPGCCEPGSILKCLAIFHYEDYFVKFLFKFEQILHDRDYHQWRIQHRAYPAYAPPLLGENLAFSCIFWNKVKLTPFFSAKIWLTPPPLAHSGSATDHPTLGNFKRIQNAMQSLAVMNAVKFLSASLDFTMRNIFFCSELNSNKLYMIRNTIS